MKFLINPNQFIQFTRIVIKPLFIITILSFLIGLTYSLYFSPNDYQQGLTVKIMYVHVPSAWLALLIYAIMTIYSVIALSFKITFGFIVNTAIAPIGAVFTFICLFTGSMWGKPMWGTWWVWDARLTSVAILFIIYIIIIFLNYSFENKIIKEKIVAIFIITGSINLPIIKFSVDWWNTLHQPASISKLSSPSIDSSMLYPLIIMTVSFALIAVLIGFLRIKSEILYRKKIHKYL